MAEATRFKEIQADFKKMIDLMEKRHDEYTTQRTEDTAKIARLEAALAQSGGADRHIINPPFQVRNVKLDFPRFDGTEVPIFDGSSREWVEAIEQVELTVAMDSNGRSCDKLAPYLTQPVHVSKGDSVISAFPSKEINISYGINFPQVSAIGLQWFSSVFCTDSFYSKQIAPSRTFCIYEEVEKMRNAGLIKGGSVDNAVVFSTSKGLLNPPLRSPEEPCRHKILDFIGDVSLFARNGSQGIPVANIVAYKGGHGLHAAFVRQLSGIS